MHLMLAQSVETTNNQWLIGLNLGLAVNDGDVKGIFKDGRAVSTSLIKPLGKSFFVEVNYEWTRTRGFENQALLNFYGPNSYWIPAYETNTHSLNLMVGYDYKIPKTPFIIGLGIGGSLSTYKTSINFLNADGIEYFESTGGLRYFVDELPQFTDGPSYDYVIIGYDDTYETTGFQKEGLFSIGERNYILNLPIRFHMMAEITDRLNIGVSSLSRLSDNDYLDSVKNRIVSTDGSIVDPTNNADIQHSLTISMTYRLRK
jgi:hypothetical protein